MLRCARHDVPMVFNDFLNSFLAMLPIYHWAIFLYRNTPGLRATNTEYPDGQTAAGRRRDLPRNHRFLVSTAGWARARTPALCAATRPCWVRGEQQRPAAAPVAQCGAGRYGNATAYTPPACNGTENESSPKVFLFYFVKGPGAAAGSMNFTTNRMLYATSYSCQPVSTIESV